MICQQFYQRIDSKQKKGTAFTLIELLVVISIVSLLISILLPALGAARKRSKQIQCAGNLRQVELAANMYVTDNKGWMVASYYSGKYYAYYLSRYLGNKVTATPDAAKCVSWNEKYSSKPRVNFSQAILWDSINDDILLNYNQFFVVSNLIVKPSQTVHLFEAVEKTNGDVDSGTWLQNKIDFRHVGHTANIVYYDGHVFTTGEIKSSMYTP
jgi:prepilin-type N-terminal cleavage/methylation domain-containing protein/prepilin-type processing-associated H-X9-DG protein